MPPTPAPTTAQSSMYGVSAGLDAVSGVFSLLAAQDAASAANSRADMIRNAALANARRYAEQAEAQNAQRSVMYAASGVTLAGSPLDVLDKQQQLAHENVQAIIMQGDIDALDEQTGGANAGARGQGALVNGLDAAAQALNTGFGGASPRPPPSAATLAATGAIN